MTLLHGRDGRDGTDGRDGVDGRDGSNGMNNTDYMYSKHFFGRSSINNIFN